MGWTTPRTWVTGAVLTAAQMNEQIRDNENYLKEHIDIADRRKVLDCVTTDRTITGTAEQQLYGFTVPGGTLGATGALRLDIACVHQISQDQNATFKIYYGSTLVGSILVYGIHTGPKVSRLEFIMTGAGSVSAQHCLWRMINDYTNTGGYNISVTENSNNALLLAVNVVLGYASDWVTLHYAVLNSLIGMR